MGDKDYDLGADHVLSDDTTDNSAEPPSTKFFDQPPPNEYFNIVLHSYSDAKSSNESGQWDKAALHAEEGLRAAEHCKAEIQTHRIDVLLYFHCTLLRYEIYRKLIGQEAPEEPELWEKIRPHASVLKLPDQMITKTFTHWEPRHDKHEGRIVFLDNVRSFVERVRAIAESTQAMSNEGGQPLGEAPKTRV